MSTQVKAAAKLRGAARTAQVELKVRNAMESIRKEISENGGVYPKNGGAVSMNEVARIACISQTTLFSPKQKALGQTVKAWVETLKKTDVVGRLRVQRKAHERAEDWRKKLIDMQNAFVATELELQDTKALLEQAKDELNKLRLENSTFHRQLALVAKSKITPIKNKND
jgi:hypothetical protein